MTSALARTALLTRDIFPNASDEAIVGALTSTRVLIRADRRTSACAAGQAAIVATALLVAQLGVRVGIDVPGVPVLCQPPLAPGANLADALRGHLADLISAPLDRLEGPVDLVVGVGESTASEAGALRIVGDSWGFTSGSAASTQASPWSGTQPFGALLAAIAASADVYRIALKRLARASGQVPATGFALEPLRAASHRLTPLPLSSVVELGLVDVVSAGAISNATLFTLARVPGVSGHVRPFDADHLDETNLNRYPLARRSDIGTPKVRILAAHGRGFNVTPIELRLTESTLAGLAPLAPRILVGVDDIPSRWLAQRAAPGWISIAGTSHFDVLISTHRPGTPCAGCAHPHADDIGGVIPTISFVSALAGLLQAYDLVSECVLHAAPCRQVYASPFNLAAPRAFVTSKLSPHSLCPVGCKASVVASRLASSA